MSKHLDREIDKLKKQLLGLCAVVEENVWNAVHAIRDRDSKLAQQVIDKDHDIDVSEIDLEEECLKILALYQPVAIDLRFIIVALKMNNDLERIGDLAVNISKRALFLNQHREINIPDDFLVLTEKTQSMFKKSLDAIVNLDTDLAKEVCDLDDEVDTINRRMYDYVKEKIREQLDDLDSLIALLSASRHLERIADHATNIAEDLIYMTQGDIVRHKGGQ